MKKAQLDLKISKYSSLILTLAGAYDWNISKSSSGPLPTFEVFALDELSALKKSV
jgi:hypothetical protein